LAPHRSTFRSRLERCREVDALEFTRGGDQVVLGARGPSISEVEGEPLGGQIFNVFTLRDGGSCASTTTGAGTRRSRQPAPRSRAGADPRAGRQARIDANVEPFGDRRAANSRSR
jgi:hypothetical protein